MPVRIIHRSPDDYFYLQFPVDDSEVFVGDERILVATSHVSALRLAELRTTALRLFRRYHAWSSDPGWASDDEGAVFQIVGVPLDEFGALDHDMPIETDAEIVAGARGVRVRVLCETAADVPEAKVLDIAVAAASRRRAEVCGSEVVWHTATTTIWVVETQFRRRDTEVASLLRLGREVRAAVTELAEGTNDAAIMNLIEAGYPTAIVGANESDWLEAKSQTWDLDTDYGKVELAQDVARFANSGGGLIVVGASTRKSDGEETIVRVKGIAAGRFSPHRARMVIDARVFPPIEGLRVRLCPVQGSALSVAYVHVPPQPTELQPFVVHGAIVGRRMEGAFVSIVKRRGSESVSTRAEELHAWLSVGRRFLRSTPSQPEGRPAEET